MIAHLLADPLGVDPKKFMDSLTCEQWDELKARHEVMPYDHSQKMLGLIAWMLGQYLEVEGVDSDVCMPWIEGAN